MKYTDSHGTNEAVTSTNSTTVSNLNDSPTGNLTITGSPTVGQKLSLVNTITDEDGIPTSGANAFKYQWLADGRAINGATANELVLIPELAGSKISALVSYIDVQGNAESVVTVTTVPIGTTVARAGSSLDVRGNIGYDILQGSNGNDTFNVFANDASVAVDDITSFSNTDDYILVDLGSFFTSTPNFLTTYGLTAGQSVPVNRFTTSTPTTGNATFIYQGGSLFFDTDGNGATAAKELVKLIGTPALTADKIVV